MGWDSFLIFAIGIVLLPIGANEDRAFRWILSLFLNFSKKQATDNRQKNAYVRDMLSSDIYHIGRRQLSISCEGTAENLRTDNGTTCLRLFLFYLLDRCFTFIRTGNGFKDSW